MSEIKQGNLIDALLNREVDYIAHVCNNKHVMGSGVAKEIRERIPRAYDVYMGSPNDLGYWSTDDRVFNLIAQDGYGDGRKQRFLHYGALAQALNGMCECIDVSFNYGMYVESKIGLPYGMGAVRSGGDFTIVKEIVEQILEEAYGFKVLWYKLGE